MSYKPEQKINARLKRALDSIPQVQAHRIEVRTGLGWPDWLVFSGYPDKRVVMIESKWVNSWKNPLARWEPHQRSFAKRKMALGIPCYLLIGDKEYTFLLGAHCNLDVQDAKFHHIWRWDTHIPGPELAQILYPKSLRDAGSRNILTK